MCIIISIHKVLFGIIPFWYHAIQRMLCQMTEVNIHFEPRVPHASRYRLLHVEDQTSAI